MRRCFHRPKAITPGDVQCTVLTSRERLRPDKPRLPQRDSLERQAAAMVTDPLEQAVRDRLVDKGRHPAAGSCSAAATSATEKSRPTMAAACTNLRQPSETHRDARSRRRARSAGPARTPGALSAMPGDFADEQRIAAGEIGTARASAFSAAIPANWSRTLARPKRRRSSLPRLGPAHW
jgi:hypothetical protein